MPLTTSIRRLTFALMAFFTFGLAGRADVPRPEHSHYFSD
jgi:hypothetical protein